jgi:hypothetical protein
MQKGGAHLSDDQKYRYQLWRASGTGGKTIGFICLNPSIADATIDDQTVRKCVRLASKWQGTRLVIANLFAFRATDPSRLIEADDPIGLNNDFWLEKTVDTCDLVVAAWGNHGDFLARGAAVRLRFTGRLYSLRLTAKGHPAHPLYLPQHLVPLRLGASR